eukprot:13225521-Alexandrium_andersonii.AAC.1
MDDSHLQAFDPDNEQFDGGSAPDANWDDDSPSVDLLPGHMRVPPGKPSQRGIDLREITRTPYAEWCEICRGTKARGERRSR